MTNRELWNWVSGKWHGMTARRRRLAVATSVVVALVGVCWAWCAMQPKPAILKPGMEAKVVELARRHLSAQYSGVEGLRGPATLEFVPAGKGFFRERSGWLVSFKVKTSTLFVNGERMPEYCSLGTRVNDLGEAEGGMIMIKGPG